MIGFFRKSITRRELLAAGGAGFVGYGVGGENALTSTVLSELRRLSVKVWQYGAVGDGVADDIAALRLAAAAVPEGGALELETGKTYRISDALYLGNVHALIGNGATIKPDALSVTQGAAAVLLGRQLSTHTGFTPFAIEGNAQKITLPEGITAAMGDLLLLKSTDVRVVVPGGTDYPHGMFASVTAVAGQVVTLSSTAYAAFSVTSVTKYRGHSKLSVTGLTIDLTNHPNTTGVYGALSLTGTNMHVSGCRIVGNDYAGAGIWVIGENAVVENCNVSGFLNVQGLPLPGRLGYGVSVEANNAVVRECVLSNNKHAITGGSRSSVIRNALFEHNVIAEDKSLPASHFTGSIDMHCNHAGKVIIRNNHITGYGALLSIRNKTAEITGNTLTQAGATGQIITTAEQGFDGVRIANNRIFAAGGYSSVIGINPETTSYTSLKNIEICNNYQVGGKAFRCSGEGSTVENVSIHGNIYLNIDVLLVIDVGSGIAASNITVTDNKASGATYFVSITGPAFVLDGLIVSGNQVSNGKNLLNLGGATASAKKVRLQGNTFAQTPGALGDYGLSVSGQMESLHILDNLIDISANTGTAYAAELAEGTYADLRVTGNRFQSPAGSFRGLALNAAAVAKGTISGNNISGNLVMRSATATACSDLRIADNTLATVDIASGAASLTLSKLALSGNTLSGAVSFTENTGGLIFNDVAIVNNVAASIVILSANDASTTWQSSGNQLLLAGNTTTADQVTIKFNHNKVVASGNVLYRKIQDISVISPFYSVPRNNKVFGGAAMTWKGATLVSEDGDLLAAAAPTSGTWALGEKVFHTTPVAGGHAGWVCTTAGTPGTWKTFGAIAA